MQKTEFQISGYLYRRGTDNSSWSNRYITLSTDTGAMKIYMEKSGKRTIKGQLNIKKSSLTELDQAGRPFAFEIATEELKGKSEEAILVLAAPDAEQYEEWKKAVTTCFSIGDSRRRKSVMTDSTSSMSSLMDTSAAQDTKDTVIPLEKQKEVAVEAPQVAVVPTVSAPAVTKAVEEIPQVAVKEVQPEVPSTVLPHQSTVVIPPADNQRTEEDDLPGMAYVDDSDLVAAEQEAPQEEQDTHPVTEREPESKPPTIAINIVTTENESNRGKEENKESQQPSLPRIPTNRTSSEDEVDRSIRNAMINAQQNVELSAPAKVDTPSRPRPQYEIERKSSVKFEDDPPLSITVEASPKPPVAVTTPMPSSLSKIFGDSPMTIEESPAPTTMDSEVSSDLNSPPPGKTAVAQKLEKKLARLSFKKPNFKNLLNDNGLDDQMKQELENIAEIKQGISPAAPRPSMQVKAESSEPVTPARTPVPPRQLSINVRPTESVRCGYLQKLDSSSLSELGEDSWLDQYASLEVTTGEMKLYAEIGGRRILRGSINANDHIIRGVDYVFYGKVFAFEFVVKNADGTPGEEAAAAFATDDLEKYSYWMITFQDCKDHLEKLRLEELARLEEEQRKEAEEKRKQEEAEAAAAAAIATAVAAVRATGDLPIMRYESRKSFRPFEGGASIFASLDDIEGVQQVQYTGSDSMRSSPVQPGLMPDYAQSPMTPNNAQRNGSISGGMKSTPSSNRLLSSANMTALPPPLLKPVPSMHERIPTASNLRTLERQPSYRGMPPTEGDGNHDYPLVDRQRSHSAAPDLEPSHHHPLAAIFNPVDTSTYGVPHTSMRMMNDNSSPLDLMSPNTAMMMQQMFVPEVENLSMDFAKIHYPMERLARRIKIWYCSSGFSIAAEKEVENFVRELRNTDDKILHAFSHEKFAYLNDWAKLLEMLRKYEEHSAQDPRTHANKSHVTAEEAELEGHLSFIMKARTKGNEGSAAYPAINVSVNETLDLDVVARKVANGFHISENVVASKLVGMLSKKDSALATGLKVLKDDLTFAEDLVLYQEEVIEHMWQSYTALKGLIEQKDAVINQLYSQLSEVQEKYRGFQMGTDVHHASGLLQSTSNIKKLGGDVPDSQELKVIADREFNNADKDGDGRISRDEWRKWIEDKHNLIQEHNQVKAMLMEEIKILRKSMNPQSQQTFEELKRSEEIRHRVEEELIRAQISNDGFREDLAAISIRLKETEQEKSMLESDWKDQLQHLQKELEETKRKLSETEQENEDLKAKVNNSTSINPNTPMRMEAQHTHGYGYSGFSPMQFPSYSAPRGASLNPYAYNMPEDRVLSNGSVNSAMQGIAMDGNNQYFSDTNNMNNYNTNLSGSAEAALDLQTIANSDVVDNNNNSNSQQFAQQQMMYGSPMLAHPAMLLLQQQQFLIQQQQQQLQQASQLLASSNSVTSGNLPLPPNHSHHQQQQAQDPLNNSSNINNNNDDNNNNNMTNNNQHQPRRSFTTSTPPNVFQSPQPNEDDNVVFAGGNHGAAPYEFRSPDDDDEYLHQSFLHHAQQQQQQQQPDNNSNQRHNNNNNNHNNSSINPYLQDSPMMLADEMYNEAKGDDPKFPPQAHYLSGNNSYSSNNNHQLNNNTSSSGNSNHYRPQQQQQQHQQQQAPPAQQVYAGVTRSMDHPLRNALRNEVRHKNNPIALVNAAPRKTSPDRSHSRASSPPNNTANYQNNNNRTPVSNNGNNNNSNVNNNNSNLNTPSYAAPIARRTPGTNNNNNNNNNYGLPPNVYATPKTPNNQGIVVDEGRVGGSGRAGSPSRFMQGTNSWKKKAIAPDRSAQDNIIMRASNWR